MFCVDQLLFLSGAKGHFEKQSSFMSFFHWIFDMNRLLPDREDQKGCKRRHKTNVC